MTPDPTPHLCPRCGRSNQCSQILAEAPADCWCFSVAISGATLAALPPAQQSVACLCPQCAQTLPAADQPCPTHA